MSIPENEIALNNEDNDNPRNLSNEQENAQTQESDLSGDGNDVEPASQQPDIQGLKTAFDAAESSFTLDVDHGIAPKKD
jgi:hypothetical protein